MAVSADDLLQDIPHGFDPDEGVGIVTGNVALNCPDEFRRTGEHATMQLLIFGGYIHTYKFNIALVKEPCDY
ncbi:hypothetical protein [Acidithiobacillus ferrooxidans]|uniref:hypothetical protein n=1 Tax=Acidithiobacillus ferrooxidans TaxID=920 RepID=UPI001C06A8CB|nr:hypothetical protein [Acidithiobacillus ferrooxidans]